MPLWQWRGCEISGFSFTWYYISQGSWQIPTGKRGNWRNGELRRDLPGAFLFTAWKAQLLRAALLTDTPKREKAHTENRSLHLRQMITLSRGLRPTRDRT